MTTPQGNTTRAIFLSFCGLAVLYGLWLVGCSLGADPGRATGNFTPKKFLPPNLELVALGKQTFEKNCTACHGMKGDGQGPASALLFPKPRDFVAARYRLVSTWDYAPLDEDIFKTISRGMPGSAMPPWAHLPEEVRWGLVHYLKTLARRPIEIRPDHQPQDINDDAAGKIVVPPAPPYDAAGQARAAELFKQNCANCHGQTGRGDGQQHQEDSEGNPVRPRDLTAGIYKGLPQPQEVYKRIMAGLPGSPMPSHPHLYGNDGWHLANFALALSNNEQRSRMEIRRERISVPRVSQLPASSDDPAWKQAPATFVRLMPLWWRDKRQEDVEVLALHDGQEIEFLMKWWDSTEDKPLPETNGVHDAVALQFSLTPDEPPFFGMGDESGAGSVNLWMWRTAQAPIPLAADLFAAGMNKVRPTVSGNSSIRSQASYGAGAYRVMLRRKLPGDGADSVSLKPGQAHSVALAVWDGSAGDQKGKESFSIWQELELER